MGEFTQGGVTIGPSLTAIHEPRRPLIRAPTIDPGTIAVSSPLVEPFRVDDAGHDACRRRVAALPANGGTA